MRPSRWSAVLAGGLLAAVLVVEFAAVLGIERLPVLAGVVGPRNAETLALGVVCVVLVAVGLARRRLRRALVPIALVALVGAAASLPVIVARGSVDQAPASAAGALRILSWNINGGLVSPAVVARLAAREHANVVVLPEITAGATGAAYAPAFAAAGLHLRGHPALTDQPDETLVFVDVALGDYAATVGHSENPDKSAALTPLTAGLPALVAIHAAQPSLGTNPQWRADLQWVARRCDDPNTIAIGDFNATLDSFGGDHLGGCADAAAQRHAASVGTWPTRLPTWAGMPLDHVLTGASWRVRSFTVLRTEDASGARHRPILAVVARA